MFNCGTPQLNMHFQLQSGPLRGCTSFGLRDTFAAPQSFPAVFLAGRSYHGVRNRYELAQPIETALNAVRKVPDSSVRSLSIPDRSDPVGEVRRPVDIRADERSAVE
jgi:hypothetical protein